MITTAQFELSRPQQGYSTTRPRRAGNMLGSTELCGYLGWFFFFCFFTVVSSIAYHKKTIYSGPTRNETTISDYALKQIPVDTALRILCPNHSYTDRCDKGVSLWGRNLVSLQPSLHAIDLHLCVSRS